MEKKNSKLTFIDLFIDVENLLPTGNYVASKKWGGTFKKETSKIVVFIAKF